ncbi:MAG: DUF6655 family protein [Rhizomicrobium sp.]
MFARALVIALTVLCLAACTTVRTTSPLRSAQEELLISTAADRAAEALVAQLPTNLSVYVDLSGFGVQDEPNASPAMQDEPYASAALKDAMLRHGIRIVADRAQADAVILPRAGALSTYEQSTLIGLPSLPLPTPAGAAAGVTIPALSLYQDAQAKGIAKFAASVYDTKTGKLIVSTNPVWGFSRIRDGVVLFVFTWSRNDVGVDFDKNPPGVK